MKISLIHGQKSRGICPLSLLLVLIGLVLLPPQVGDDLDLVYGARTAAASGARTVVCIGALIGVDGAAVLPAVVQVCACFCGRL